MATKNKKTKVSILMSSEKDNNKFIFEIGLSVWHKNCYVKKKTHFHLLLSLPPQTLPFSIWCCRPWIVKWHEEKLLISLKYYFFFFFFHFWCVRTHTWEHKDVGLGVEQVSEGDKEREDKREKKTRKEKTFAMK